jgi:hypothetical protein
MADKPTAFRHFIRCLKKKIIDGQKICTGVSIRAICYPSYVTQERVLTLHRPAVGLTSIAK